MPKRKRRRREEEKGFLEKHWLPIGAALGTAIATAIIAPKVFGKKAEEKARENLHNALDPEIAWKHRKAFYSVPVKGRDKNKLMENIEKSLEEHAGNIADIALDASLNAIAKQKGGFKSWFKGVTLSDLSPEDYQKISETYEKVGRILSAVPVFNATGIEIKNHNDLLKALETVKDHVGEEFIESLKKDKAVQEAINYIIGHDTYRPLISGKHIDPNYIKKIDDADTVRKLIHLNENIHAMFTGKLANKLHERIEEIRSPEKLKERILVKYKAMSPRDVVLRGGVLKFSSEEVDEVLSEIKDFVENVE